MIYIYIIIYYISYNTNINFFNNNLNIEIDSK